MYKISELRELIKLLDQTSIHSIEIENEHGKLAIKKPKLAEPVIVSAPPTMMPNPALIPQPAYSVPQVPAVGFAPVVPAASLEAPASAPAEVAEDDSNLHKIVSPMVGTFYCKPSPDNPEYVNVGDRVTADKVVCILEAMKLMNELKAEVDGEIVKILVSDGQIVEFGQPLFLVKTDA
jgi:acetyl-CoA carboxylase biotin carboxyl carrier protein